ncbi:MAG: carbon-nitrogen hydrolase family protein [Armatimonadota bacterium]
MSDEPSNLLSDDWRFAAPRPEVQPRHERDASVTPSGAPSLSIWSEGNEDVFGRWYQVIEAIEPCSSYRFSVYVRTRNVGRLWDNVVVRLYWRDGDGRKAGKAFVHRRSDAGDDWQRLEALVQAPPDAASLEVQLFFRWSANGRVWFADAELLPAEAPEPRPVRLATSFLNPPFDLSPGERLQRFVELVDEAGRLKADALCLPECPTFVGADRLEEAAAPIPGPHADVLAEAAARNRLHLATSLHEREGSAIYNTGVLFDRQGKLLTTYRKTHLAFGEGVYGVRQGRQLPPVVATDFGRVGLLVCYDYFFPEMSALLARDDAEVVFLPIWEDRRHGDDCWRAVAPARAIDSGTYLVAAMSDGPSLIVDPLGRMLVESDRQDGVFTAEVDLSQAPPDADWLRRNCNHTWRNRLAVERRPGIYRDLGREA